MKRKVSDVVKILPNVYHIYEVGNVYCTLVVGQSSALLIDTGFGVVDIPEYITSVTELPYEVINTHGHIDHITGNNAFPYVYISSKDLKIVRDIYAHDPWENIANSLYHTNGLNEDEKLSVLNAGNGTEYRIAEPGHVFDLGGAHLEVVSLPGHTPGSVGLLYHEERLLITGDAINSDLWLFLPGASTFAQYRKMLERTMTLPFDQILSSHSKFLLPKDFLNIVIRNIDTMKHDQRTRSFNSGRTVFFTEYTDGDMFSRITYSEDQLK